MRSFPALVAPRRAWRGGPTSVFASLSLTMVLVAACSGGDDSNTSTLDDADASVGADDAGPNARDARSESADDAGKDTSKDAGKNAGEDAGNTPCADVVCEALDACHDVGTCDPKTGACSNPTKADGTTCTDGSLCTENDTCQAGVCTGGAPVACTASDGCHVAGVCDSATGTCSNPAKADGSSCSDDNLCTENDTCQAGVCTGSAPIACTASDGCHVEGVCDPATGTCSNPAKPDGSSCDDGNYCPTADTCQAGVCIASTCPPTSLSEDFETNVFPANWFRFNVDGRTPNAQVAYVNDAWIVRDDFTVNRANHAAFSTSYYGPVGAADDWMVTSSVTLPPAASCSVTWKADAYDPNYPDGYEVRVFTSAPTLANLSTSALVWSTANENRTRDTRTADLTPFKGKIVWVAWRNNSNDKFLLVVDDIKVFCN